MIIDKKIIEKYTSYFHDGSLIDIQYGKNSSELIFSIWSAEVDPEEISDLIPLSHDYRIKGKLHLSGVQRIEIDGKTLNDPFIMNYDTGGVFDFIIEDKKVVLHIIWTNYPPKERLEDFSVIQIEMENVYWENIPDLKAPFFRE
jgi:hypothetical protein